MRNRFDNLAYLVFQLARQEAETDGWEHPGTQHLLLALMRKNGEEELALYVSLWKNILVEIKAREEDDEEELSSEAEDEESAWFNKSLPPSLTAEAFENAGIRIDEVRNAILRFRFEPTDEGRLFRQVEELSRSSVKPKTAGPDLILLALLDCNEGALDNRTTIRW